jgi:lysophospholipase L1-like esterase
MVERGRRLGLAVGLADVLPWNNGEARAVSDIDRLNVLVHERAGVPLLPFHGTLVDPERPHRMRDGLSDDGDHPSVEGHRLLGELAFRLSQ